MTRSDFRRTLEFLRQYCLPATPERFVPQAIEGLLRLVSCDAAGCGIMDPEGREGSAVGYPAEFFSPERNQRGIRLIEPQLTPLMRPGRFMRFSEFFGRTEFHNSAMYEEHFRPMGIEDVIGMGFGDTRGISNFFTLERSRVFSDRDQEILNAVAGPLQAKLANARVLAELEEHTGIIESTLQSVAWNGLVVGHQGRVCLESPQARRWLIHYFGRHAHGDRLPDSLLRWMRGSADELRQPSSTPPRLMPYSVVRSGRRLVIPMLPHPSGYLLILDEQQEGTDLTSLLALGLSRRQAQILSYVTMGKTNGEIAMILEMSRRTVEKHVEQILARLGVETRTAAAAMALEAKQTRPRL